MATIVTPEYSEKKEKYTYSVDENVNLEGLANMDIKSFMAGARFADQLRKGWHVDGCIDLGNDGFKVTVKKV